MGVSSVQHAGNRGLQKQRIITGPGYGLYVGAVADVNSSTTLTLNYPAGTAEGDLAVFVAATRNSTPNVNGPDGDSSWTSLASADVGSEEYNLFYYKILGSSPSSVSLTISAADGDSSCAGAVLIVRGPTTLHSFVHGQPPRNNQTARAWAFPTAGHERGFQVFSMVSGFSASDFDFSDITWDAESAVGGENPRAHITHWHTFARGVESPVQSYGAGTTVATNHDQRFWSSFNAVFV